LIGCDLRSANKMDRRRKLLSWKFKPRHGELQKGVWKTDGGIEDVRRKRRGADVGQNVV